MKRYFLTKEGAERHLKVRVNAAKKRIKKRGDAVIADNSRVYNESLWTKPVRDDIGELRAYTSKMTDKTVWRVWLEIITKEQLEDLKNLRSFDTVAALEEVLVNELKD